MDADVGMSFTFLASSSFPSSWCSSSSSSSSSSSASSFSLSHFSRDANNDLFSSFLLSTRCSRVSFPASRGDGHAGRSRPLDVHDWRVPKRSVPEPSSSHDSSGESPDASNADSGTPVSEATLIASSSSVPDDPRVVVEDAKGRCR